MVIKIREIKKTMVEDIYVKVSFESGVEQRRSDEYQWR